MRNLTIDFLNKKIDYEQLLEYGFTEKNKNYVFETSILDNQFQVVVEISKEKQVSKVIDLLMDEEYVLVDVKESSGDFIGRVKEEYEKILNDIIERCTTLNVFKSKQAQEIIQYVKEKYSDDLEYLWEKFPNYAVWRNKVNNKWYAVLMVLSESKLKIDSDKIVDVIDLRYQKENIKEIIDNKKVFEGYHMNKKSWITIKLDGSMDTKAIYELIDNSYKIS